MDDTRILELVKTVPVPALARFAVADHFKEDTSAEAKVKISPLERDFRWNFLSKIEEGVAEARLRIHNLHKTLPHQDIRDAIGKDHEETTLAHLFHLLSLQPKGERGHLRTDLVSGFYIRNVSGILWAVGAYWCIGGWHMFANPAMYPHTWNVGSQVFSRDP